MRINGAFLLLLLLLLLYVIVPSVVSEYQGK
jgi:hypothetical protein